MAEFLAVGPSLGTILLTTFVLGDIAALYALSGKPSTGTSSTGPTQTIVSLWKTRGQQAKIVRALQEELSELKRLAPGQAAAQQTGIQKQILDALSEEVAAMSTPDLQFEIAWRKGMEKNQSLSPAITIAKRTPSVLQRDGFLVDFVQSIVDTLTTNGFNRNWKQYVGERQAAYDQMGKNIIRPFGFLQSKGYTEELALERKRAAEARRGGAEQEGGGTLSEARQMIDLALAQDQPKGAVQEGLKRLVTIATTSGPTIEVDRLYYIFDAFARFRKNSRDSVFRKTYSPARMGDAETMYDFLKDPDVKINPAFANMGLNLGFTKIDVDTKFKEIATTAAEEAAAASPEGMRRAEAARVAEELAKSRATQAKFAASLSDDWGEVPIPADIAEENMGRAAEAAPLLAAPGPGPAAATPLPPRNVAEDTEAAPLLAAPGPGPAAATPLPPRNVAEDTEEETFQELKNTQVAALIKQLQSTGIATEEEAIRLIDSGYPVIGSDEKGMTPLMIASQRLMLPVVKAILDKLARYAKTEREADAAKRSEANKVNKDKKTALDLVNDLPVEIKTHTQYTNSLLRPGADAVNLQRQLDDAEMDLSRVRAAQAMKDEAAARKEGAFSFSPANVVYPKGGRARRTKSRGGRNIFTNDRSDILKLLAPITESLAVRAQRADIFDPLATYDPAASNALRMFERAGVKDPPPEGLVLRTPPPPSPNPAAGVGFLRPAPPPAAAPALPSPALALPAAAPAFAAALPAAPALPSPALALPAAPALPSPALALPAAPALPSPALALPAAAPVGPPETTKTPKNCPENKAVGKHVSIRGEQANSIRAGTVVSFVPWEEADRRTNKRLTDYKYGQCHIRVRWADTDTDQILDPSNVTSMTDEEFNAYVSNLPQKAAAPAPALPPLPPPAPPAAPAPSAAAEAEVAARVAAEAAARNAAAAPAAQAAPAGLNFADEAAAMAAEAAAKRTAMVAARAANRPAITGGGKRRRHKTPKRRRAGKSRKSTFRRRRKH